MTFGKVTHVIFDLDGLLLNSEIIHHEIMANVVKRYGKEYTAEVKRKILGTVTNDTIRITIETLNLPIKHEEYLAEYNEKVKILTQHVELMPGAETLVKHFHKHKVPISIATSSSQEEFDIKAQDYLELFQLFNHIVCGGQNPEVKKGKPAPDIYLVAASKFPEKPSPDKCLVFEDAPNGVVGARAAGMQCVMVPADYITDDLKKPATLVLKSLKEFKPELFGLPPCACS